MIRHSTALTLLALVALAGCRADLSGLQVVDVEDLAAWRGTRGDFAVCDANSPDTRDQYGVIPGAILLSNYRDYDPAAELPADKAGTVVFYCHSEMCGAAADAARKAITSGYRDVWVLAPGIQGWAEAGQPIERAGGAENAS